MFPTAVKTHGEDIRLELQKGEGSEFIIQLSELRVNGQRIFKILMLQLKRLNTMKKVIILLALVFSVFILPAQNYIDSLKKSVSTGIHDSTDLGNLFKIVVFYINRDLDSSMSYIQQFNQVESKPALLEVNGLSIMGDIYLRLGNASKSLEILLEAMKMAEKLNEPFTMGMLYWNIGKVYQNQNEYEKAISYYLKSLKISSSSSSAPFDLKGPQSKALANLGSVYLKLNKIDSALSYSQSSYLISKELDDKADLSKILAQLGNIYEKSGHPDISLDYYRMAINVALPQQDFSALSEAYISIAELLKKNKLADSSYYYARQGFIAAEQLKNASSILKASNFLKNFFKDRDRLDSAFTYQEIEAAAKDSMLSLEIIKKVQIISFEEQQRGQEIAAQKREAQNKIKLYALIILLAVFLFVAIFLYRNNRQKQKVNTLLQHQKEEIQKALTELKSTQVQLIQSEKMASLGELTAGIAHEIQNPLNFVNNFSDVNNELIEELKIKNERLKIDDTEVNDLLHDIYQNNEKISMHGKRADSIVKGMLQHSRTSSGQKEPTDINTLADEYLRLAYHGLRAKDKSFNSEIKTDFDPSIEKVNIVRQDIGRVLLNLINNAFYAVGEKAKLLANTYEPSVLISTKRFGDKILISISDNGNGISQKIVDKIFQPFFTTKPTGQGTGLGLSLAYDIIKAHGGEIKVETREGEGSEFSIVLPVTPSII